MTNIAPKPNQKPHCSQQKATLSALLTLAALILAPLPVLAASFFVADTLRDVSVSPNDARAATSLIRNAVANRAGDSVVMDEYRASYVLQPRLIRVGQNLILTIEKIRGRETLFAAQARLVSINDLDRAAFTATKSAIEEPAPTPSRGSREMNASTYEPLAPYDSDHDRSLRLRENSGSVSGATSSADDDQSYAPPAPVTNSYTDSYQPAKIPSSAVGTTTPSKSQTANPNEGRTAARAVDVIPKPEIKGNQWMVGFGPFLSRRLSSDLAMYNGMVGHKWNINARASVKAMGEMTFSSGRDSAQVYNVAAGGNYYVPGNDDTSLYFTGDMGYGVAKDARGNMGEGFSLGTGAGVEFFRTTQTTLDLLLRYSVIFDNTQPNSGYPSVVGARMAVNF